MTDGRKLTAAMRQQARHHMAFGVEDEVAAFGQTSLLIVGVEVTRQRGGGGDLLAKERIMTLLQHEITDFTVSAYNNGQLQDVSKNPWG